MKTTTKYTVEAPRTAGARPVIVGTASTIREARKIAKAAAFAGLTYQDVRIDRDGKLAEYAGPAR